MEIIGRLLGAAFITVILIMLLCILAPLIAVAAFALLGIVTVTGFLILAGFCVVTGLMIFNGRLQEAWGSGEIHATFGREKDREGADKKPN